MAEVARRGKPVLLMPDFRATGGMEREIARRHPALSIIHAHGFDADWARAVADAPNVFVEFCTSAPSHRNLRDALDILGPERVLFGSDQTLLAVGGTLGAYLDAALTPAERRLVLHENARRIFRFP
jgi:predicted TIM-barrel fold metal-dependent hydrolase